MQTLYRKQQGMTLVMAIVITLLVGLMAISIGNSALQNQRVAAIKQEHMTALANAQSGIAWAEGEFAETVLNDESRLFASAENTISSVLDENENWWREEIRWQANNVKTLPGSYLNGDSRYRIEERDFQTESGDFENKMGTQFFRVTAQGRTDGDAIATIQTLFSVAMLKPESTEDSTEGE